MKCPMSCFSKSLGARFIPFRASIFSSRSWYEIFLREISSGDLQLRSSSRSSSESVSLILTRSFEISNVFKRFKFAAAVRGTHPEQYARTRRSGGGGGGGSPIPPEDGHHKGMLAESNAQPSLTNTYEGLIRFTRPHTGLSRLRQWCYPEHIWRRVNMRRRSKTTSELCSVRAEETGGQRPHTQAFKL
jgi:hypothetical protein